MAPKRERVALPGDEHEHTMAVVMLRDKFICMRLIDDELVFVPAKITRVTVRFTVSVIRRAYFVSRNA